jgi:hypothetical protein
LAITHKSPTDDTGIVYNVINHLTLQKRGIQLVDLQRLCWIWEWDGLSLGRGTDDENPFLTSSSSSSDTGWQRGGLGIVVTPASFFDRELAKNLPAYAIGIKVEKDGSARFPEGMAAVARWTSDGEARKEAVKEKLQRWSSLHKSKSESNLPQIPCADWPGLKTSSILLHRRTLSRPASPDKSASHDKFRTPPAPSDPSPSKLPVTLMASPAGIPFPKTPKRPNADPLSLLRTPSSGPSRLQTPRSTPQTSGSSVPATPTSERRAALYERVRQKSVSKTITTGSSSAETRESFANYTKAALRRRCLLGRLGSVAEGLWM